MADARLPAAALDPGAVGGAVQPGRMALALYAAAVTPGFPMGLWVRIHARRRP